MTELLLATADSRGWVPFVTPLPMWGYWWVLLFPIVTVVALVYKLVKTEQIERVPAETVRLAAYIVLLMVLGAVGLAVFVLMRT